MFARKNKTISTEARVAAAWWTDKLRGPAKLDNGAPADDPVNDPMARGMMAVLQQRDQANATDQRIEAFEMALAGRVQQMFDRGVETAVLDVDYHPDAALTDALRAAEIPASMTALPWKTCMWIRAGSVKVSEGYRAQPVELALDGAA